jgi:Flp pilus assembly protein CpaB
MVRRSPRALALWGAAAAVALVTAVVVASDLATIHRRAADLGPVVPAAITTRDVALGTELRATDLAERPVHRSELPAGVIKGARTAVGRVITVPVVRGGFVTKANLAPRRRTGLDGAVPAGMRAMRVIVTNPLRPRPGAAVDVLATFNTGGTGGGGSGDSGSSTVVVAAGVVVIDVDTEANRAGAHGDTLGITLLVDADDAERLAFAEANGVVTIALVPPEDAAHR